MLQLHFVLVTFMKLLQLLLNEFKKPENQPKFLHDMDKEEMHQETMELYTNGLKRRMFEYDAQYKECGLALIVQNKR
jgi:hypothetical protein